MLFLGFAPLVSWLVTAVWLILGVTGLYVYGALIRQIRIRAMAGSGTTPKTFGVPEALVATLIMSLLLIGLIKGNATPAIDLSTWDLINNFVLTAVVVLVLAAFLTF